MKEIRKDYTCEILILFFAGLSGIMIYNGNWFIILMGLILLFCNSYFLVTRLKELVLERYELNKKEAEEK